LVHLFIKITFCIALLFPTGSFAKDIVLGDTKITVDVIKKGSGPTFVLLHDNEQTADTVTRAMHKKHGGKLIHIGNKGKRRISFKHEGKPYHVDPNRIYSDVGIKRDLKPFNAQAAKQVSVFAKKLLSLIGSGKVVAVHSNTNGAYSILSYKPGGSEASATQSLSINDDQDPDDFILTTDSRINKRAVRIGVNSILHKRRAFDDGSLSVYMANKGRNYTNVDAQNGHKTEHRKMLEIVLQ